MREVCAVFFPLVTGLSLAKYKVFLFEKAFLKTHQFYGTNMKEIMQERWKTALVDITLETFFIEFLENLF